MLKYLFSLALALATSNGQPAMALQAKSLVTPQNQVQAVKVVDNSGAGCLSVGVLSVYHDYYQGRQTANGELFDQGQNTIAIWDDLPFGWYRLTNLNNGRSVRVFGNDTGAFKELGRIADASAAAFSAISGSGTTDEGLLGGICLSYD